MLAIEYEEIEIDYCDTCHGIWLDEGELDLLFGDHAMTHGFLTAGDPANVKGEAARPCPLCDALMNKAVTGGPDPVVYDYCPEEHGLWFDSGELLSILKHGSESGPESPVVHWLRQVFPQSPPTTQTPTPPQV